MLYHGGLVRIGDVLFLPRHRFQDDPSKRRLTLRGCFLRVMTTQCQGQRRTIIPRTLISPKTLYFATGCCIETHLIMRCVRLLRALNTGYKTVGYYVCWATRQPTNVINTVASLLKLHDWRNELRRISSVSAVYWSD